MAKHLNFNNIIIAAVIYTAWVIGFSFYTYQTSKVELLAELDKRLELSARNYVNVIPEDLHHKNMSKSDLTKKENRQLLLISNEYAKINGMEYLYSIIKKDNKVYFTMGNATKEDMAEEAVLHEGGGYYFVPYEAEAHYYKSFEVKEPIFQDTHDKWGDFRTVLIQHYSKDGTMFVVGADIKTSYIEKLLWQELIRTFIISVLFLIFALPILVAYTSQTRRWAKNLELQTKKEIASEVKLTSLVKLAVDAIITMDDQGIVTAYNNSAESMFGYTAEEVIGNDVKIIMPNSIGEQHAKFLQSYFESGEGKEISNTLEISAQHKNGTIFPIEISVTEVVIDKTEKIFSAIIRDLTYKKEKEKQLHKLIDEAEAANKAKSDFLGKMSHELRTPLHGILAFSSMGVEKSDTDKTQSYFTNIQKSGERLKILLDDLLDLSKLEAGKMEMNLSKHNIRDIINDCIMEQQAFLKENNLNVSVIENTDNHYADCDIDRISQVILNFLNNAIKFSPENTTIKISISDADEIDNKPDKALQVSVSDQGKGIPENQCEDIFDKFTQLTTVNDNISGTGLGLAISSEIIQAHNGSIWCQEAESNGAEFVFRIPIHHS